MKGWKAGLGLIVSCMMLASCADPVPPPQNVPQGGTTEQVTVPTQTEKPTEQVIIANPKVTGMAPQSGKIGSDVTISGENLEKASEVCFGATCGAPKTVTATAVVATVPAGEGSTTVTVTVDGKRLTAGMFSYLIEKENKAEIDWCQLTWVGSGAKPQEPIEAYAQVYEEGITGSSAGHSGIVAQIGYIDAKNEKANDVAAFKWVNAKRNEGFNSEASVSNDEYMADNIKLPEGDYLVAYRFSLDGSNWLYCDQNGSSDGFSIDQAGRVHVQEEYVEPKKVGWCRIMNQPTSFATTVGGISDYIYAQAFVEDCTKPESKCDGLKAQVGYGSPALSDISAISSGFTWVDAKLNDGYTGADSAGMHDEFMANMPAPAAGRYAIIYRMSMDGTNWTYCDTSDDVVFSIADAMTWYVNEQGSASEGGEGGNNQGGDPQGGDVTVTVIKTIEWCRVQAPDSINIRLGSETPMVYGRVYVPECTGPNYGCSELKGQVGYGPSDAAKPDEFKFVDAVLNSSAYNPGNNDEYMALMKPDAAGDYKYVYRFSLDGENWTYCDYNDDLGFDMAKAPQMTVTEDKDVIGWCRTQYPGEITANVSEETETIYGQVYVEGCTEGEKTCDKLKAQVGYGPSSEKPENYSYVDAKVNDKFTTTNNDEYMATLNVDKVGDYSVVYRFSLDDGATWEYCDFDDVIGFNAANMSKLSVTEAPVIEEPTQSINWCRVQHPGETVVSLGASSETIYGQVLVLGCTEGNKKCDTIKAQVGYGDKNGKVEDFKYVDATYNSEHISSGNDEYMATIQPDKGGDYAVVYRFSLDNGANWTYCDYDDAEGFDLAKASKLTVKEAKVDWCRVQHPGDLIVKKGTESDYIYGRVLVQGCTEGENKCDKLKAQVGYGDKSGDVASFEYVDAQYNDGFVTTNNDEYMAKIKPTKSAGEYALVYRFSTDNGTTWEYCDFDDDNGFKMDSAARLTITEDPVPEPAKVHWCQLKTYPNKVKEGDKATFSAEVYVDDECTKAQDNGCPNLTGYVGIADASEKDPSKFYFSEAAFEKDAGNNNDIYSVTIEMGDPGEAAAIFAFSMDNGKTYFYCDTSDAVEFDISKAAKITVEEDMKEGEPFVRGVDYSCGVDLAAVNVKYDANNPETQLYGQIWIPNCTGKGTDCRKIVGSHVHYINKNDYCIATESNFVCADADSDRRTVVEAKKNMYFEGQSNDEYMAGIKFPAPELESTYYYLYSFDLKRNPDNAKEKSQRVYCYPNWDVKGEGTVNVSN